MDDLTQLLLEHRFWHANHSSIGSEDHCLCGFRPRNWMEWAHHVQSVEEGTGYCTVCGHAKAHHIPGMALPRVDVCADYVSDRPIIGSQPQE